MAPIGPLARLPAPRSALVALAAAMAAGLATARLARLDPGGTAERRGDRREIGRKRVGGAYRTCLIAAPMRLAITDPDGRLIGLVDRADLLRAVRSAASNQLPS